jgi:hypothetical protein
MFATPTLHRTLLLALLMSALLLAVSGCSLDAGSSTDGIRSTAPVGSSVTRTVTPTPTATAGSSPTVPAYLLQSAPLLPAGWTWYRDSTGHFQVPLAPGWKAGGYYGTDGKKNCFYNVQFFPPGEDGSPGMAQATYAPRLISIGVNFTCSPWSPIGPAPQLTKEPDPVLVDSQPVTVWDNDTPGEIESYALATFHGHQYSFDVQSRDSNFIVVDAKAFHQMLHGFEYTGN